MKDLSTSSRKLVTPLLPLCGPLARCPGCGTPLDGGPVLYRCQACRRAVPAADVDVEYHAPGWRAVG